MLINFLNHFIKIKNNFIETSRTKIKNFFNDKNMNTIRLLLLVYSCTYLCKTIKKISLLYFAL